MAVGILFDGVGVTKEQYEQVLNEVGGEGTPGLLHHVAGASDGGIVVVEVWESQAALNTFVSEKLGAALQAAGITLQPKIFEVFNEFSN
jgi:quinol monooxygenase YgiN